MRYRDNREQSAELLRMVLPLMSRHSAGFHPLSYAVWYEYSAGTNQPLRAAIDHRTEGGKVLDDAAIQELFDQYVAMRDIESTSRLRVRIQEVVAEVGEAATQVSAEVGRYSNGLDAARGKLAEPLDPKGMAALVEGLMGDTSRVLDRTTLLKETLKASADAAQRIGVELDAAGGKSLVDPLTGMPNRRGFEHEALVRHARGLPAGALMMVEIDRLALLAEQFGHVLADRAIAAASQIVVSTAGITSLTARIGSSRLAVWLAGIERPAADELAARMRAAIERCRIRRQDSDAPVEAIAATTAVVMVEAGEAPADALERATAALEAAHGG